MGYKSYMGPGVGGGLNFLEPGNALLAREAQSDDFVLMRFEDEFELGGVLVGEVAVRSLHPQTTFRVSKGVIAQ
jgi:hypothetical protein